MATKPKLKLSDFFNPNPGASITSMYSPKPAAALSALAKPAPNMDTINGPGYGAMPPLSAFAALGANARPVAPAPVAPAPAPVVAPAPVSRNPSGVPVGPQGATGAAPASQVPSTWLKADGTIKTPDEIANDVGGALASAHGNGDIGTLALGQFGGSGKSAVELEAEARRIGNTRNDIAVGETDPYKVASQSGIAYTPAELSAIEKAYSGVYDPALDTALAKVAAKQKSDDAAAANTADLEKMKVQFGYDKALKQTPAAAAAGSGSAVSSGVYVPGANPAVDAWAQRIFDGNAKITDIPASQKGMRDAVVTALQAAGNDLAGHATVTELGKSAKTAAAALLEKLDNREGTGAVGGTSLFNFATLPGSERSNFKIDFQNLKDTLSLDGVRYLKGQGAVSDAERALLASAVTKLNLAQSEEDFRSTLVGIVNQLSGNANQDAGGGSGGITVTAGGQTYTFPDQASADAFKKEAGI